MTYPDFGALMKLKSKLKTISGVSEVHQRRAAEGEALVEVKTSLSAKQLAKKLGQKARARDGHVAVKLRK